METSPRLATSAQQMSRELRAFSLVEVTIAIGIVSFILLTMLGLMPVGLSTLRQAMDQTVEGQIAQKLNGDILMTPFSQIADKYSGRTIYFNEEGVETNASESRYKAKVSLGSASYPGASTNTASSLQVVRVDLIRTRDSSTNRFSLFVPNSGN